MAPLSKAVASLLLPYHTFGNHLDSQGRTIEVELEMRSLKRVFDRQILSGLSVLREFNNGVAITEPVNLMRNLGLASIAAYCSTSYRSLNALMAMLWSIPYKLAQNISKSIPSCSS